MVQSQQSALSLFLLLHVDEVDENGVRLVAPKYSVDTKSLALRGKVLTKYFESCPNHVEAQLQGLRAVEALDRSLEHPTGKLLVVCACL